MDLRFFQIREFSDTTAGDWLVVPTVRLASLFPDVNFKRIRKIEPSPNRLLTSMLPFCASSTHRAIGLARPATAPYLAVAQGRRHKRLVVERGANPRAEFCEVHFESNDRPANRGATRKGSNEDPCRLTGLRMESAFPPNRHRRQMREDALSRPCARRFALCATTLPVFFR
jgi:hypothetical protein